MAVDPEQRHASVPIQWTLQAVEAPAAWAAGCTGDGVRVAVIDGGIYAAHLDLDANIDVACSASFVPGQPFNNDAGTFWHGTHVAGIVAAADNNIGAIGIAPDATIIGVKVLHGGSGSVRRRHRRHPLRLRPGRRTACARADIINMSLGADVPARAQPGGGPLVAALSKAVNYAASKGVLVVSAAGNNGLDLGQSRQLHRPSRRSPAAASPSRRPARWASPSARPTSAVPPPTRNYGEGTVTVAGPGGDFVLPGNAICTMPRPPAGTITSSAGCSTWSRAPRAARRQPAATAGRPAPAWPRRPPPAVAALDQGRQPGPVARRAQGRSATSRRRRGQGRPRRVLRPRLRQRPPRLHRVRLTSRSVIEFPRGAQAPLELFKPARSARNSPSRAAVTLRGHNKAM